MANHTRRPIADRLFEKLAPRENGCIEFVGACSDNGYGKIARGGWNGGAALAHRVAWELAHGPIPDGLDVCHHCDNRPCCNVEHLFLGTRVDNMQDALRKGRTAPPPIKFGEQHHGVTTPDAVVRQCREDYVAGMSAKQIADARSLAYACVWRWVTGRGRLEAGGPLRVLQ